MLAEAVTLLVMGLPSQRLEEIIGFYVDWWSKKRYNVFFDLLKKELKNVKKSTRKRVLEKLDGEALSETFSLAVKIFPMSEAFLPSGEINILELNKSVPETLTHALLNVLALYGEVDDLRGLREAFRISILNFKEKLFGSIGSLGMSEIMSELANINPEYSYLSASFERVQAGGVRVRESGEITEVLEFTPSVVKAEPEVRGDSKWLRQVRTPGIGENRVIYEILSGVSEFPCFLEEDGPVGLRAGSLKTNLCKMFLPLSPKVIEVLEDVDLRENLLEIEKIYLDQLLSQMAFDPDFFRFVEEEDRMRLLAFLEHLRRDIVYPMSAEGKKELLITLSIIEGRVFPSEHALAELKAAKPLMNPPLQYEYYLQLGYNLLLSGDLVNSAESLREAYMYAEDEEQTVFLQIMEALVKVRSSQFEEAIRELERCYNRADSPKLKGIAAYYTGMLYYVLGEFQEAYRVLEDAARWLQSERDAAAIRGKRGVCALRLGMYDEALQEFKALEALARNNGCKEFLAAAYEALGTVFSLWDSFDMAVKYFGMALELDRELNDEKSVSDDYSNIGTVYYRKGRYEEALKYYRLALENHKRMNEKRKVAIEYNNIGVTLKAKGKLGKALQHFTEALRINEETGNMHAVAINCSNIASVLSESGKRKDALAYLERALSLNMELGELEKAAENCIDMGKLLADMKDFDFSLEFFEKALKIHKELGKREEMIQDYTNMGLVLVNKGDIKRAVALFELCLKLSEELNYLKWVESTLPKIFKSYSFLKKRDPGRTFYFRVLEKFPELAKQL